MYDYLVVGAGLFGSIIAYEANKRDKKCLVIDKRSHIGGNIYTEEIEGINVHMYGAHIFHTNNKVAWEYINQFAEFNRFINSPIARYKDQLFNLPFNMNTFNKMWGVITPLEAMEKINKQILESKITKPKNLEEQAIFLVGKDIYEKLIKGYTEKQWGCSAADLPAFIIKRIPVRYKYDNNYFSDGYQGIPIGGYTQIVKKLLYGIDILLNEDYFNNKVEFDKLADTVIFTGMIDEYYNYLYGKLGYRSLRFETEVLNTDNFQGNAVVNYTEYNVPFTRIIEHKHFEYGNQSKTIITREFPLAFKDCEIPYYPINDTKNNSIYEKYRKLSENDKKVKFGGRLGTFRYLDMDKIILEALNLASEIL